MNKYEYYSYMKHLYFKLDENEIFNLIIKENDSKFSKLDTLKYIFNVPGFKFLPGVHSILDYLEKLYSEKDTLKIDEGKHEIEKKTTNILIRYKQDMLKINNILKNDYVLPVNKMNYLFGGDDSKENNNKKLNIEKKIISLEKYLNSLTPIIISGNRESTIENKLITLYKYSLDENQIIPGVSLENLNINDNEKRQYTIICDTDCIFGTLSKKTYSFITKERQVKFHKNDIAFLLKNELFAQINIHAFGVKYFGYFETMTFKEGTFLLEQGKKSNKIYFLIKGESEVTLNANIYDLYELIKLKGGQENSFIKDSNYFKRFYSVNIDKNFYEIKRNFKIFNIKENFPIGLEDYSDNITQNNLFSVKCTVEGKVLAIDKKKFNDIVIREKSVSDAKIKMINESNNVILQRLESLRNHLFQNFLNEQTNQQIPHYDYKITSCCVDKANLNLNKEKPLNFNYLKTMSNSYNSTNSKNRFRLKKRLIDLKNKSVNSKKIIEGINEYKLEQTKKKNSLCDNKNNTNYKTQRSSKHYTIFHHRNNLKISLEEQLEKSNQKRSNKYSNTNKITRNNNIILKNEKEYTDINKKVDMNTKLDVLTSLDKMYNTLKSQESNFSRDNDNNLYHTNNFYGFTFYEKSRNECFNNNWSKPNNRRFLRVKGNNIKKAIKEVEIPNNNVFKDISSVILKNKSNNSNFSNNKKLLYIINSYTCKKNKNGNDSQIKKI